MYHPSTFVISLLILLVGDINRPNLFESVEFSCSPDFEISLLVIVLILRFVILLIFYQDSPRPVLGTTLVLSVTKRLNEPYGYDDDVVNPLMDTNVSPYKSTFHRVSI